MLPEPILAEVESIKQRIYEKFGIRGALRSPAHITIHRPFEWKEEREEELKQLVQKFNKNLKSITVTLKGFKSFDQRVIYVDVLPSDLLNALYISFRNNMRSELAITNEWNNSYGFTPHVTVAFRDLKKNQYETVMALLSNICIESTFGVEEISILKLEDKWRVI